MALEQPPPLVLALVLADNGHLDPSSNKYFILGTISAIRAASFPTRLANLCVYAALTDARGKTVFTIRLVDADESREPVFSLDSEVDFETPLAVMEIMYVLVGAEIPEAGEYRLQLLASGQLLCERRLIAAETPGPNANS